MKKSILALILGISFCANAQEKMDEYLIAGKKYSIQVSFDRFHSFALWIEAQPLEGPNMTGGILIDSARHGNFISSLERAKAKYSEWVKTAKDNKVTDFSKEMVISCTVDGYFLYGREWHFTRDIELIFRFRVMNQSYLIINTGVMKSSSNEYIDVDGFIMHFASESDISSFIKKVSMASIQEFKNKPKKADLFKN